MQSAFSRMNFYIIAIIIAYGTLGSPVCYGQLPMQTWVSAYGNDGSETFSKAAPGRTFAAAIKKTAAGGTISCLDVADYGALTIKKSITIDAGVTRDDGVFGRAYISTFSGNDGITIQARSSDTVNIKHLKINGAQKSGVTGIYVIRAGAVSVMDTVIAKTSYGISATLGFKGEIDIKNCYFNDNENQSIEVVAPKTTGEKLANITISGSQFKNNKFVGCDFHHTCVRIDNCRMSTQSGYIGVSVGEGADVTVNKCTISGNDWAGLQVRGAEAKAFLSGNIIQYNTFGISTSKGGVIKLAGDNTITDNYWLDVEPLTLPKR